MHTKHPPIYDRCKGEIIKYFTTPPPHVGASILAYTLVVESVNLCDLSRLVVPTNKRDPVGISDFESEQEKEGFDAVETAVDKIA